MSNQFQPLAAGEVVSIQSTYRVSELTGQIRSKLNSALAEWSSEEGIAGEALRFGSVAWQKGKVRLYISIEFAADDNSILNRPLPVREPFYILAADEVVSIKGTYRVSEITAEIRQQLASVLAEWSNEEGIVGEALRFGSLAWEKGRIRLYLTLEFCPDHNPDLSAIDPDMTVVNPIVATGSTAVLPPLVNQIKSFDSKPLAIKLPRIDSTIEDDQFDLGTMSPVTGEIEMNLSDSEDEQNGYVDFDLSASIPEINLEELVSRANVNKPSLIDEVWNEMSQPNWPGVGRA